MRSSPNKERYYYPDLSVTNEVFADDRFSQQPVMLGELLSPSTRSYDTVDKFIAYRTIPAFGYYLLPLIIRPTRENGWQKSLIKKRWLLIFAN